jgi:hypothetical protein
LPLDVSAPPELRTITLHPLFFTIPDSDFNVPFALVPLSDTAVEGPEDVEVSAPEEDAGVDDGSAEADSADELVESDVEGSSAQAATGVVATAPLIPSATARAPMRPMCLA